MKTGPHVAGQINLRGKKFKMLRCGCCYMRNVRWSERLKQAAKETREVQ